MPAKTSNSRRLNVAIMAAVLSVAGLGYLALPAAGFGSSTPPPSPPSVNAGGYVTCGITEEGTAACWGADAAPSDGLAGPGMATPPSGTFLEVNNGYSNSCGVRTDGTLACWGSNVNGASTPPAGTFTHVAVGLNFGCALEPDGNPVCWGTNDAGQVSNAPTSDTFTQLTVGIRHACGLRADGTITCWGSDAYGQIAGVPAGTYTAITSGNFDVCAIRPDATVDCWGRNAGGQDTVPAGSFTQVSAGFQHVCGLRPDGSITCWGSNTFGQGAAPAGTYNNVSAGTFHSCAMPTTGQPAVCWGNNAAGRVQPNLAAAALASGNVGVPYSSQLNMSTYVSPPPDFAVVAGTVPPGLALSESGLLSGTPTQAGTFTFTVAASNGLSPPDCELSPATGDFPCTPGDPGGPVSATKVFDIVIQGDGGSTTTTSSSLPPTTTTSSTLPPTTTTSSSLPPTTTTSSTLPPTTTTSSTLPPTTTTSSTLPPTTTTSSSLPPTTTTSSTLPPTTTTSSTPPPTSTTSTTLPDDGPLTIDDSALSNGTLLRITGTVDCDEGRRFRLEVDVTQGDTVGQGVASGNCTGDPQSFRVNVRASSGPGFVTGDAQVDATAEIGNPGSRVIEDTFSTSETVAIEVPGGFMGQVVNAFAALEG